MCVTYCQYACSEYGPRVPPKRREARFFVFNASADKHVPLCCCAGRNNENNAIAHLVVGRFPREWVWCLQWEAIEPRDRTGWISNVRFCRLLFLPVRDAHDRLTRLDEITLSFICQPGSAQSRVSLTCLARSEALNLSLKIPEKPDIAAQTTISGFWSLC